MSESRSRDTRETVKPLQGSYKDRERRTSSNPPDAPQHGWSLLKHHTMTVTGW